MSIVAPEGTKPQRRPIGRRLTVWGLALLAPALASAATMTVTTLDDADAAEGDCSLREAIVAANSDTAYQECPAGAGADEIEIAVAGTVALVSDLPRVEAALTVRGLGAGASVIDGGGLFEIFHITQAAPGNGELLRIEGLQLTGGVATEGGAIFVGRNRALEVVDSVLIGNQSSLIGGAIRGDLPESMTILRSSLIGNTAGSSGGAVGVQNGVVTIEDSTLAGNVAANGSGGGVYALFVVQMTLRRSTLSGNQATLDGGGFAALGPVRLESSTVVGNFADSDGDDSGGGGGVSVAGGGVTGTLVNSLVAGNDDLTAAGGSYCPDGQQKLGGALLTEGFNLVGANECWGAGFPDGQPNVNGDRVGTAAAPIDAVVSLLDAHGGPTFTHLPLPGSPAIDQGSCPGAVADQRGYGNPATLARIVDDPAATDFADGCDVGSVEAGALDLGVFVFVDGFESGDTSAWSSAVE